MSDHLKGFTTLVTAVVATAITFFTVKAIKGLTDENNPRKLAQQLNDLEKENDRLISFLDENQKSMEEIRKLLQSSDKCMSASSKDGLGPTINNDDLHPELKHLLNLYRKQENFDHKEYISNTIRAIIDYFGRFNKNTPVIGVSGGIDSLTVFLLCCLSQKYVIESGLENHFLHPLKGGKIAAVRLPIKSNKKVMEKAQQIIDFAKETFSMCKIIDFTVDQTIEWNITMKNMNKQMKENGCKTFKFSENISKSNKRTWVLYYIASTLNGLVMGTGNKNEDGFIFFFSVAGDGRVDLAPIWNLTKKQVYEVAYILGAGCLDLWSLIPTADLGDQGKNGELEHTDADEVGCGYDAIELIQRIMTEAFPIEGTTIEEYLLTLSPEAHAQYNVIYKRVITVHKRNSFKLNLNPVRVDDLEDSRNRNPNDYTIQDFNYVLLSKSLVNDSVSEEFNNYSLPA
jgi:NAD+ synthase (glutamine-hydrolysing)